MLKGNINITTDFETAKNPAPRKPTVALPVDKPAIKKKPQE